MSLLIVYNNKNKQIQQAVEFVLVHAAQYPDQLHITGKKSNH